jgi:hypothetical protein
MIAFAPAFLLVTAGLLAAAPAAHAQWTTDTSTNLVINNNSGDQVQPKVVCTSSGRTLIAFFDNSPPGGYDVRLQSLDAAGNPEWAIGGILIADRAVSSTVDYDLAVDAQGNAYVTYNDDGGVSGTSQQIAVQKVSPSGEKLWGDRGVTLTSGTTSKNSPKVSVLSGDGTVVVGWIGQNNFSVRTLTSEGVPAATSITVNDGTLYVALSDLKAVSPTEYMALYIRGTTASAITSAKALYSQKFNAAGVAQWNGGAPVIIFNTSSVQNGYFPSLVPDGSGGGIVGFYENGGSRNSYVQHVLSSGTRRFATPVATTGATANLIRISCSVAYDATTDQYYTVSEQSSSPTQGTYSVIAQKIDGNGQRMWGDGGIVLQSPGTRQPSFTQARLRAGGMYAFGFLLSSATTADVVSWGIDDDANIAFSTPINTTFSGKSRLASAVHPSGYAVLAFGSGSSGNTDLLAQNLNANGTLGLPAAPACLADTNGDGSVDGGDFIAFINSFAIGDASVDPLADVIVDGTIDGSDFIAFINAFGAGC